MPTPQADPSTVAGIPASALVVEPSGAAQNLICALIASLSVAFHNARLILYVLCVSVRSLVRLCVGRWSMNVNSMILE